MLVGSIGLFTLVVTAISQVYKPKTEERFLMGGLLIGGTAFLSTIIRSHRSFKPTLSSAATTTKTTDTPLTDLSLKQHPNTPLSNLEDDDEENKQQPNNPTPPHGPRGKDIGQSSYISIYDVDSSLDDDDDHNVFPDVIRYPSYRPFPRLTQVQPRSKEIGESSSVSKFDDDVIANRV
ncbi:hypothetical protein Tco_0867027 [Tanacetum coccineum]